MTENQNQKKAPSVLIIDDEMSVRESMRFVLEQKFNVITAEGVLDGIKEFLEKEISVIIIDIRMPKCDGIRGVGMFRVLDPIVPIIVVSGYGSSQIARDAMLVGATQMLAKPFDCDMLIDAVSKVSSKRSLSLGDEGTAETLSGRVAGIPTFRRYENDIMFILKAAIHDIKNAFSGISVLLSTMSASNHGNAHILSQLATLKASFKQCDQGLKTMRMAIEGGTVVRARVELNDFVERIISEFRPSLSSEAKISFKRHDETARVYAIPEVLSAAIVELLRNAASAQNTKAPSISLRISAKQGNYVIHVSDDGPGIPEALAKKIFSQPERGLSKGGWGLYLARVCLAQMEARISLSENPANTPINEQYWKHRFETKTTFDIEIPKAP